MNNIITLAKAWLISLSILGLIGFVFYVWYYLSLILTINYPLTSIPNAWYYLLAMTIVVNIMITAGIYSTFDESKKLKEHLANEKEFGH